MIGTLINVAAIIIGSAAGLLLRRGLPKRVADTIMQGLGLCVVLIGLSGALKTQNTLLVILCIVIGGALGSWIDVAGRLDRLGAYAEAKLAHGGDGGFAKGFVTATLVYCVGAMAIVGALDSGIRGDHATLIAKSMLDGVSAIVFAGTLGAGVMLSAVPVLLYQGGIALLGQVVAPLLSETVVLEMSAVGGLLIVGIGVNMLLDKDIKVGNLLPAILMPVLYFALRALIAG